MEDKIVLMHTFGQKLREHRMKKGLTGQRLSECSGISQGYVSQLERSDGVTVPSLKTIHKLAQGLKTDVRYLLDWAGYGNEYEGVDDNGHIKTSLYNTVGELSAAMQSAEVLAFGFRAYTRSNVLERKGEVTTADAEYVLELYQNPSDVEEE